MALVTVKVNAFDLERTYGVDFVSKSHLLQCREQLQLLSAGRVPICLVATLVSLATAARSLCHYSTQGACWLCSGSNMIAICSNMTVYVGVTIFALCGPVGE